MVKANNSLTCVYGLPTLEAADSCGLTCLMLLSMSHNNQAMLLTHFCYNLHFSTLTNSSFFQSKNFKVKVQVSIFVCLCLVRWSVNVSVTAQH